MSDESTEDVQQESECSNSRKPTGSNRDVAVGMYVLVRFNPPSTAHPYHYARKVRAIFDNDTLDVNFSRLTGGSFMFPVVADRLNVIMTDIVLKLTLKDIHRGRHRFDEML